MNVNQMKTQKEIQDLVIRAKEGDNLALEELYKAFKGFIHKTAFAIYLKNYEQEDLIQIANESIANALKKYKPEEGRPFLPYVLTAIKKNFNNLIRKNSRYGYEKSLNVTNGSGFELMNIIPDQECLEDNLLKKEMHVKLNEVIKKLSRDDKEIIDYLFIKEYRVSDFAKLKNLDYWVCQRKVKALLKKLRTCLK
ncbi:MAG: sigma-70 family RNA polymerase sigma factor [Clostridiaceae bacterium]|nr:sigma-70 family RNA polymerase sigma factor [Clostridiaceae bacterium]